MDINSIKNDVPSQLSSHHAYPHNMFEKIKSVGININVKNDKNKNNKTNYQTRSYNVGDYKTNKTYNC